VDARREVGVVRTGRRAIRAGGDGAALRLRLGNGAEFEWSSVPEVEWLAALVERLSARA